MAKKYKGFKGSGMNKSRKKLSTAAQREIAAVIARAMFYQLTKQPLPSAVQKDMEEINQK